MTIPITCLNVRELEPGIALLTLDMPDRGANILTQTLFAELDQSLAELTERTDLQGLIVYSAKPSIFIAGADLNAINDSLDWPDSEIIKFCNKGRAVMARLSRAPFVTVAAIHGACVGGGLELTLWCDCRIATDDRRTQLGLPEVKLGLVPGWAGTARLPRMIGFEPAAELLLSGRSVSAAQAKDLGFVDQVCKQEDLLTAAAQLIQRVRASESFIHHRRAIMGPVSRLNRDTPLPLPYAAGSQRKNGDDPEVILAPELAAAVERLGETILKQTEIYPYAPTVLLEHLARTCHTPQSEAWKSESLAMAQVWGSPANRGLLNHFFLLDRNKKQPGLVDTSIKSPAVTRVGIVGAGLMGRAIAENCVARGLNVSIYDADIERAKQVVDSVSAAANKSSKAAGTIERIKDWSDLRQAQWIIESVVETESVKKSVLKQIEQSVEDSVLIASNTSAIPISQLAKVLVKPERFCGIHFCHPELMALVEVPCGDQSSEATIAAAVALVRQLGKLPVAMNDGPGFVVNRLLAAMINQSMQLLLEGHTVELIDEAMRDFGFLGGPFEIIDTIGVDTCIYAGRTMWEAGLSCVTLSPILPKLMKLGRLGRKTGVGIYRYASQAASERGQFDPEFARIVAPYQVRATRVAGAADDPARLRGHGSSISKNAADLKSSLDRSPEKISRQIVSAMVLEATRILDEEIVGDLRDIELCVIQGLSFPQHRGGLFFWSDATGLSETWLGKGGRFYHSRDQTSV
jgi:3-hydroxyacyl-CoA dehydrogenase/enoyl-CoA hydratase/3-hydroxybutyryl-CoA epimerase/3-hydroxyacyl-CoA dehydrogenase/enoyl-CoA hydratase/3-hydroxybutyryl-CoA epimerase/enoyl-CoA isomerase